MNRLLMIAWVLAASVIVASENDAADKKPSCEPGYKIVEETVYKTVVRSVCRLVPDVEKKKKWVYSTIDEPFCIKKTLTGRCCDDGCACCKGPFCKKLLVKREVVEECPTTKCIVDHIVEKIPCTVYRKVPCDGQAPTPLPPPKLSEPPLKMPEAK